MGTCLPLCREMDLKKEANHLLAFRQLLPKAVEKLDE